MKGKIIGIIAIIIVIGLVAVGFSYFSYMGEEKYWETETDFGMWQDELVIEFEDGTTESMKIIQEGWDRPFAVYYRGKAITKVSLSLYAQVTGEGYTGAEVKTTDFGYDGRITERYGTTVLHSWSSTSTKTHNILLGTTEEFVNTEIDLQTEINDQPDKYPAGDYNIRFTPTGTVTYRGYPDGGDWATVNLPAKRTITVSVSHTGPGGSILIILTSGVVTS